MGLFGKSKKEEAVTWIDRANALIDINSYEDAITCCDKALKIDPDDSLRWDLDPLKDSTRLDN